MGAGALGALFVHAQAKSGASINLTCYLAAAARAGFLERQFIAHWKPGWCCIMDPVDSAASSWTLIVAGVVQTAAFTMEDT